MKKTIAEKEHIKSSIENAAINLFLTYGYKETSVRAIAAEADMTNGNIYFYFKSKEEIYSDIVSPAWEIIKELISSGQELILHTGELDPAVLEHNYKKAAAVFKQYRFNILVLFIHNEGTAYTNVREQMLGSLTEKIQKIANTLAHSAGKKITKEQFYFRLLAVYWVEGFLEIVRYFKDENWAAQMLHDYVQVIFSAVELSFE